jgi:atypical dual specificity phosphatase
VDWRAQDGTPGIDSVDFFLGSRDAGGSDVGHAMPASEGPVDVDSFQTVITLPRTPVTECRTGTVDAGAPGDDSVQDVSPPDDGTAPAEAPAADAGSTLYLDVANPGPNDADQGSDEQRFEDAGLGREHAQVNSHTLAREDGETRYDACDSMDGVGAGISGIVPNAFDWLIPDRLGACVNPGVGRQAAQMLEVGGVKLIVNMHEMPDDPALLERLCARTVHLPVPGSCAPTQEQLDRGVAEICEALGRAEPVAVHCGAGLGRAGTLLAAYLVSQGCEAEQAMERVRGARRGSIETIEQEQAVREYAQRRRRGET